MSCISCEIRLDHCHGTLLRHVDGSAGYAECTEPRCADLDLSRHVLVVDCVEVDGGCACAVYAGELLAAAP